MGKALINGSDLSSCYNNCIIADLSQQMHKDFPFKDMSQSYLKTPTYLPHSPPNNSQSIYQPRPSTTYMNFSPDRMNHSFVGSNALQNHQFRPLQLPVKQNETMRSCLQLEYKENSRFNRQEDPPSSVFKVMEQRVAEAERRLDRLEKQERKSEMIGKSMEEVMRLQLKDIKFNEQLQERLDLLEEMMKHLKTTKLDRKQLETVEYPGMQLLEKEIQDLWKHQEGSQAELRDHKERLHRLVDKIENSVLVIGEKYEEFIESNIIKSIEHVNKLTHHYHEEIESFKISHMQITNRVQAIALSIEKTHSDAVKQPPFSHKMMEATIPNIRIVQTIAILNEKKGQTINSFNRPTSVMASYKNSLLNTLYDSIDKSTESSSAELQLEKLVYKIDREYYLLDENDHYLLDAVSNRVRLSSEHIRILEENGLLSDN